MKACFSDGKLWKASAPEEREVEVLPEPSVAQPATSPRTMARASVCVGFIRGVSPRTGRSGSGFTARPATRCREPLCVLGTAKLATGEFRRVLRPRRARSHVAAARLLAHRRPLTVT